MCNFKLCSKRHNFGQIYPMNDFGCFYTTSNLTEPGLAAPGVHHGVYMWSKGVDDICLTLFLQVLILASFKIDKEVHTCLGILWFLLADCVKRSNFTTYFANFNLQLQSNKKMTLRKVDFRLAGSGNFRNSVRCFIRF